MCHLQERCTHTHLLQRMRCQPTRFKMHTVEWVEGTKNSDKMVRAALDTLHTLRRIEKSGENAKTVCENQSYSSTFAIASTTFWASSTCG